MKGWLIGLFCLLVSGTSLAAGPAAARARIQASMLLTGTIVVAPDGSVRSYAIDHADVVEPAVTALMGRTIPQWKFQPVLLDGQPVAAQAKMSLRVVARPIGDDNYKIAISGTHFGQDEPGSRLSAAGQQHPRYPERAVRARVGGTVYLVLRVGRQGQVEDAAATRSSRSGARSSPSRRSPPRENGRFTHRRRAATSNRTIGSHACRFTIR
jgi:hypothetical protein